MAMESIFEKNAIFCCPENATNGSAFRGFQKKGFWKNLGMYSWKLAQKLIEIILAQLHIEFLRVERLDDVFVDSDLKRTIEITKRSRSG